MDSLRICRGNRLPWFQRVKAPKKDELEDLVQLIRIPMIGRIGMEKAQQISDRVARDIKTTFASD